MRTDQHPATTTLVRAAGRGFALAFGAAAAARGTKPLHPRGTVVPARIERTGATTQWDVPWLDEPGVDEGYVRLSRAMGLPPALPDILGLALSFTDAEGRHDLLLATTGMAPVARHLFLPRIDPLSSRYGSVWTYVTPRGQAVLGAVPGEGGAFSLLVAPVLGAWEQFATLSLGAEEADQAVSLDPVLHPLPGLALHPALAALRAPAYAASRKGRGAQPVSSLRKTFSPCTSKDPRLRRRRRVRGRSARQAPPPCPTRPHVPLSEAVSLSAVSADSARTATSTATVAGSWCNTSPPAETAIAASAAVSPIPA